MEWLCALNLFISKRAQVQSLISSLHYNISGPVCLLFLSTHLSLCLKCVFPCVQVEMRSQDQALVRQLMELHSGIQELKQELSEGEQEEETDGEEEEEDGSCWDSGSERGSGGSDYSGFSASFLKRPSPLYSGVWSKRAFSRRSSVP